jgi:heme exporter protein A
MLTVENLGKRFGDRWIFRRISFELGVGDRLLVTGRNGAGKSTLLWALAGLNQANEGSVRFSGDPRVALGFAALSQPVYAHLTVAEHLELTADLRGCEAQTDAWLDYVELRYAADVRASDLSSGMRARLRFALAIQAKPTVLLLDEPSASLDEEGRRLVERIVGDQALRGCTVLATNDPLERRLANLEVEL